MPPSWGVLVEGVTAESCPTQIPGGSVSSLNVVLTMLGTLWLSQREVPSAL